jgi:putative FmdB family regulatory protein
MPLYEYRCRECDHTYEKLERMSAPSSGTCPECGGEATRLIGVPALQFKGSGWYVTDYGKGTGGAAGEAPKKGATNESKKDSDSSSGSGSSSSSGSSSGSGSSSSGGASKKKAESSAAATSKVA